MGFEPMQLGLKIINGIGWTLAGRQVQQFTTLITLAILALYLRPADFGLIGMLTVISGFAMLICDTGFSAALIQNQRLSHKHYSSVFWVNLLVGIVVFALCYLSSGFVADFYNAPELTALMQALSFVFILIGTGTVPQALLRKEMKFKRLVIIESCSHVFTGLVVIYMALIGLGVWALIVQIMLQQAIKIVCIWLCVQWRPSVYFSYSKFKEVFDFSANVLGLKIIYYCINNMDYILIGRFLGPEILGYYTLAYKIMFIPIRNICQEINKVLFPAFSAIQSNKHLVLSLYLQSLKGTALIIMPMLLGMIAIAEEFVMVFFGEGWLQAVGILQLLCVVGILQAIPSASGTVFQSLGRAGFMLILSVVNATLLFSVLITSVHFGIEATIQSLIGYNFVWLFVLSYFLNRMILLKVSDMAGSLLYPVMLSMIMFIGVMVIKKYFLFEQDIYMKLLLTIISGIAIYFFGLYFLYKRVGLKSILAGKNSSYKL